MAITAAEARTEILTDLAGAIERIALASASLGEAYELLSVTSADRLEGELFRPVQRALGRAKRTYTQFAERTGLPTQTLESPSAGPASQGVKALVEQALVASAEADHRVGELQDSNHPVEFGDPELRKGLTEVRASLVQLPGPAREFLRTLGR